MKYCALGALFLIAALRVEARIYETSDAVVTEGT